MELKDTVALMTSADYKDRLKAEYLQLKIRIDELEAMVDKWDAGLLDFTPTCPRSLYGRQLTAMAEYLDLLCRRSQIESAEV